MKTQDWNSELESDRRISIRRQAGDTNVADPYYETFFKVGTIVMLLILLWVLAGCATSSPLKSATSIAKTAVLVGTVEYLRVHPEDRWKFEMAQSELRALSQTTNFEPATIVALLQNVLPTDTFTGDRGALYLSGALVLWSDLAGDSTRLENPAEVRAAALEILQGLDMALGAPLL